ncbi:hypothetical protein [Pseudomonas shirazensis]|uniref:hypothetical protein n=1 Tax=Pseudomonas shirazensis TaxID=2745494 RepID=UPI003D278ECE
MTTTNSDIEQIRKALAAYNDFCFDYHATSGSWHAKAVAEVTSRLGLTSEEAIELSETIHGIADEFAESRIDPDAECDYTVAADESDIREAVKTTAGDFEFCSFADFRDQAKSDAHGELCIRVEDEWILDEAIDEFSSVALASYEEEEA